MGYSLIINNDNIIEIQYNNQFGGYETINNSQVINLWQNPDYNGKFINYYSLVNKYLRREKIKIESDYLDGLKIKTQDEFYDFMIYYTNKLTNIIYKNTSTEKEIFFRGEHRKEFNYKVGDTLFYPTFQSVSASVSTAYKFSEYESRIKILFVIQINKGFHYKALTTRLKIYNYARKITKYIDEKEYLLMPNSYYTIVEINMIEQNFLIVKLDLFFQDYYQIDNRELYEQKNLVNPVKKFNSSIADNFIKKYFQYKKIIEKLNSMEKYKIAKKYYDELIDEERADIFNLPIEQIQLISQTINILNIKEKVKEIKDLGLKFYKKIVSDISKYKESILTIQMIRAIEYNSVNNLSVYIGFNNYDKNFNRPKFVNLVKQNEKNIKFSYERILITNLTDKKFLYSDMYNDEYPHCTLKKKSNSKLIYYKYLFKLNLSNVKICVCSSHYYEYENNIILIPNFSMEIINKTKLLNKYDLEYEYWEINVS